MAEYGEYMGFVMMVVGFLVVKVVKAWMRKTFVQPGYDAMDAATAAAAAAGEAPPPPPKGITAQLWDKAVALDAWLIEKLAIHPPPAAKKDGAATATVTETETAPGKKKPKAAQQKKRN